MGSFLGQSIMGFLLSRQFRQRFVSGSFKFVSRFLTLVGDTWEDVYVASTAGRQLLKICLPMGNSPVRPLRYILHTHMLFSHWPTFCGQHLHFISNLVFDIF